MNRVFMSVMFFIFAASTVFAQNVPYLAVPKVKTAPVIDGKLQAGEWNRAAVTSGFCDARTSKQTTVQTRVSICYDNTKMYLLYECYGESPNSLIAAFSGRDSDLWGDSCIEFFITSSAWPKSTYAHAGINSNGSVADELCDPGYKDLKWNADWKTGAGKTADSWYVEVSIPFSDLKVTPSPGTKFRVNFTRNASSIVQLSSWADMAGSFHQPSRFGEIELTGTGCAARIPDIPVVSADSVKIPFSSSDGSAQKLTIQMMKGSTVLSSIVTKSESKAVIPVKIPDSASTLLCRVNNQQGKTIWLQKVRLDSQRMLPRLRAAEKLSRDLSSWTGLPGNLDINSIQKDLKKLKADFLSTTDKSGLSQKMNSIERRLGDLYIISKATRKGTVPDYIVTNPSSMDKVLTEIGSAGPSTANINIAMCKGEYEPAQIVVTPIKQNLLNVGITVTSLTGPKGTAIPVKRIVVNPVGYVQNIMPAPGTTMPNEVPDVLLPNRTMNVSVGRRQPFYITVQTLASDAPGEYKGYIRITSSGLKPVQMPIKVKVYNITIPRKSHMRTAFVLRGNFKPYLTSDYMDTYIRYSKFMLEHRISPITMLLPVQQNDGSYDFSDIDKYMEAVVPAGLTTANIGSIGSLITPERGPLCKALADHFKQKGWWDLCYVYGYDEASAHMLKYLKDSYSALQAAVPDVKIMQTAWNPGGDLDGLVKIWCPLTVFTDLDAAKKMKQSGEEMWWYVCMGPGLPCPNVFVDNPGIDHRILGWQTYKYGISGLLYWGVDVWAEQNKKTPAEYDRSNFADFDSRGGTYGGDGYLLYPGVNDTPVDSIRLAVLRDGIEDYDLFTEVSRLAQKRGKSGTAVKNMLRLNGSVDGLVGDYITDGNLLLLKREQIMQAAEKLSK